MTIKALSQIDNNFQILNQLYHQKYGFFTKHSCDLSYINTIAFTILLSVKSLLKISFIRITAAKVTTDVIATILKYHSKIKV